MAEYKVTWAVSPQAQNTTLLLNAQAVNAAGPVTLLQNTPSVNQCGYQLIFTSAGVAVLSTVVITGTAGQFSCAAATLVIGMELTISGTFGGTGSITGYSDPTTYWIIATNGTTTFTLSTTKGGAGVVTTAGTPTGLTYTLTNVGATYTIVGEKVGQVLGTTTEVLTVPTGTTANSVNYYSNVISITASTALVGVQSIGITGKLAIPRCRIHAVNMVGAATAGTIDIVMAGSGKNVLHLDTPATTAFSNSIDTGAIAVLSATAGDYATVTLVNTTFVTLICG